MQEGGESLEGRFSFVGLTSRLVTWSQGSPKDCGSCILNNHFVCVQRPLRLPPTRIAFPISWNWYHFNWGLLWEVAFNVSWSLSKWIVLDHFSEIFQQIFISRLFLIDNQFKNLVSESSENFDSFFFWQFNPGAILSLQVTDNRFQLSCQAHCAFVYTLISGISLRWSSFVYLSCVLFSHPCLTMPNTFFLYQLSLRS